VVAAGIVLVATIGTATLAHTLSGHDTPLEAGGPSPVPDLAASASVAASVTAGRPAPASASASASAATSVPAVHPTPGATAAPSSRLAAGVSVLVSASGTLPKDHQTLTVVYAKGDLTGHRELTWVADGGHAVGSARCSQKFRVGPTGVPAVRPTMLICWHTSATRSVYTVLVDLDHAPSERESVATISRIWSTLR
jgi:hypothetical protein